MLETVSDSWHRAAEFNARPAGVAIAEERVSLLTDRQKDVMRMLAEGMINKQIAHRLDISVATVKTHIAAAVRRMKARNRIHAVAMLIRAESFA